MNEQWQGIIQKIKGWGGERTFIPLHEPTFTGNEKKYVLDCVETGWVSSVGKYVDQFEEQLAAYTGSKKAVAVVNGTAALHIALKLGGVQDDDEVLIPSLSFVATANAVRYCGAIPHFVDVEESTLGLDPVFLTAYLEQETHMKNGNCINKKTGRTIRAIVPMHTFGHPVRMDELSRTANNFNLILIEDAAESLGSFYKARHTGTSGLLSAFSFNGNKTITTGGGGALITDDEALAREAKHLTTTAKIPHAWEYTHDQVGYNYRMPNLNAALGCAQIEQLPTLLEKKRKLAGKYKVLFTDVKGIKLFEEPSHAKSNYWLQTIMIDTTIYDRNELLTYLNENGVMARPIWTPLHELTPYMDCPSSQLPITSRLKNTIINLPSSPYLGE